MLDLDTPIDPPSSLFENALYKMVRARHGIFLANKYDQFIGKALIEYGEFSEIQWKVFEQIVPKNGTVIDVGANIGGHTIALASHVGEHGSVWAYEPQPVIFQVLCANIALNAYQNIKAFHAGCAATRGEIVIPSLDYNKTANFGGFSLDDLNSQTGGQKVDLIKLDDEFDEHNLHFIKVDVEGMELDVLKGADKLIKKHKPVLYVENDRADKSPELIEFLFSHGYKAWWHCPRLFNPDNFFKKPDNIFRNYVTVNLICVHESVQTTLNGFEEVQTPHDPLPINQNK